ncbi:hypothetical protein QEX66_gp25 [Arthrobacter phage Corgi]|uniref:Uncharacterized protein n=1 Tax=Arthrobacter phage Corgi TaxID=2419952 RepID=A0A3G2KF12_9CAUD|nr:hypothetical protein QEX66_gp25 [Arthrobacter phage Corgi]AYN57573.1 hypothetical protein PBI_CORGI_25 [Arthrobacter phage Corgi]
MSRKGGGQRRHAMDPVTLVHMARLEPAAAQYILDRRRRGVPARGLGRP